MPLPMYKEKEPLTHTKIENIIAVAAGKGGVGKSTVAVNLALALSRKGLRVGLMDTDVYGPSVRKMLPEDRLPAQKGDTIFPALCQGVKMISMAYFRNEDEATAVRAPIANGIISQFLKNVSWGDLDYLLIDFPPGTGDIQLTLCQQANLTGAILVSTPQEIACLDVRKARNLFDQLKVPVIGVVENMCGYYPEGSDQALYLFGRGAGQNLAREAGVPFLGEIPIDPEVSRRADLGISIFDEKDEAKSVATKRFLQMAESLVSHTSALKEEPANSMGSFEVIWKELPS